MTIKTPILISNLGSPNSCDIKDIEAYLKEFLMDPYVIDYPFLLRYILVNHIIIPKRLHKTREAYSMIWTKKGSPLVKISRYLCNLLKERTSLPIYLAMRYGEPKIDTVLAKILEEYPDLKELKVLPLYPQYAMATVKTLEKKICFFMKKRGLDIKLTIFPPFYNHFLYIEALADSVLPHLKKIKHLVCSYHGLPVRHLRKTDPFKHCLKPFCCDTESPSWNYCYKKQCLMTTNLLTKKLGLDSESVSVGFQSRLGSDKWIEPNSVDLIKKLAKTTNHVHVICPSFVTDCLETLEEVHIGMREIFLENGGKHFTYIPCLNIRKTWVEAVSKILLE